MQNLWTDLNMRQVKRAVGGALSYLIQVIDYWKNSGGPKVS